MVMMMVMMMMAVVMMLAIMMMVKIVNMKMMSHYNIRQRHRNPHNPHHHYICLFFYTCMISSLVSQ